MEHVLLSFVFKKYMMELKGLFSFISAVSNHQMVWYFRGLDESFLLVIQHFKPFLFINYNRYCWSMNLVDFMNLIWIGYMCQGQVLVILGIIQQEPIGIRAPSGKIWHSYWKWPFIWWVFHVKWWWSVVMLVYQRVIDWTWIDGHALI